MVDFRFLPPRARHAVARARVVESQLQRTPDGGYAGTVVLAFGSGA